MDLTTFNTLAARVRPAIIGAATRWLASAPRGCDTPDDVAQDTLLRLWAIRHKLDDYTSVDALAMVTARRIAIDALRRSGGHIAEPLTDAADSPASDPAPDAEVDTSLAEALASRLLTALPSRQAMVVAMRHRDGLELSEIASATGLSEGNVRTLLSRGRSRLRQLYLSSTSPASL